MVNSVVISGCFKGIEGEELLLKVEGLENHQIVRINISKGFQKELNSYIKENDLISIKRYIEIDDLPIEEKLYIIQELEGVDARYDD